MTNQSLPSKTQHKSELITTSPSMVHKNPPANLAFSKTQHNVELIPKLKSEFNAKMKELECWYIANSNNLNTIENKKVETIANKLKLISEIFNKDFEAKHFFEIKDNLLRIYGTEVWKWSYLSIPISKNYLYYSDLPVSENYLYGLDLNDTWVVELPNSEIFCLKQNNFACKIDLKTWRISKLFTAFSGFGSYSSPIYYKNCIYLFSNEFRVPSGSRLEKYDLIKDKKDIFICPFISHSNYFMYCLYQDSILIWTMRSTRLCKFDFLIESYSENQFYAFYGICSGYIKMLFSVNKRVYIVDERNLFFESEIDNHYIWSKICEFNEFPYDESINREAAKCFYFANTEQYSMEIYQFDLDNKKIYRTKNNWYGNMDIKWSNW
ncbi:unnamed protein product [Blepharisma stoltei]|uniref:Uncharacterized protein n=1 Tax=Blepharisma stoltei TaxID=1481888 RepID=A0AAU9IPY0_9CILI|nr:unnamed protein product [Blepharisma stoltei]